MKTLRRRNPLAVTVRHYIGSELRELRELSRKRFAKKKEEKLVKSDFVRFMEGLEKWKGKISMYDPIHERWTKTIRADMEKAGTWPKPDQEMTPSIIVEYLSRLQAEFWKEFPNERWNRVYWFTEYYKARFKPYRFVMERIWKKIRRKGKQTRAYKVCRFEKWQPSNAWLDEYPNGRCKEHVIHPYTPPLPKFFSQILEKD
jgi:hypothetical protein